MAEQAYEPRLKSEYRQRIRAAMKEQFGYTNEMQIPKLDKIVINMGVGEAVADSKKINSAMGDLAKIAGQKPIATKARTSIAGFKLREGMTVGCKVTLRKDQLRVPRSSDHDRIAACEGLPGPEAHVLRWSRQLRHGSEGTHRVPGDQLRPDRPDLGHGHHRHHHCEDR